MKKIKLTQRKYALVDDEDFEYLNQFKWFAIKNGHTFYAARSVWLRNELKEIQSLMHREIIHTPKGKMTAHLDGNGLNNRKYNMRVCSNKENQQNRQTVRGKSKYKGVYLHKQKDRQKVYFYWSAQIKGDKEMHLGSFKTEKEAALAYNKKAKELFGEFAYLNKI